MADNDVLSISTLENWLWEAACVIRGPLDAPKFKDYILPLIFLKRLSDVFDDELDHLAASRPPERVHRGPGPERRRVGHCSALLSVHCSLGD